MIRLKPKYKTLRALFSRSGNQCAIPGCTNELINQKNQFIGQICHIEAALKGGPRYNSKQSEEDRRSYDNLLLLCYPHHIETNDIDEYPVDKLKRIKYSHESEYEKNLFKIDESLLYKIADEMELYWNKIDQLNKLEHAIPDFKFNINAKASFFNIIDSCRENIKHLREYFNIFRETQQNKYINWELHNIGVPNRMAWLNIYLMHLELKYIEEFLKINVNDSNARRRLDTLKKDFEEVAKISALVD